MTFPFLASSCPSMTSTTSSIASASSITTNSCPITRIKSQPLAFVHHRHGMAQRMISRRNNNNRISNNFSSKTTSCLFPSSTIPSHRKQQCWEGSSSSRIAPQLQQQRDVIIIPGGGGFVAPRLSSEYDYNDDAGFEDDEEYESEEEFLQRELSKIEALEKLLQDVDDEYYDDTVIDDLLIESASGSIDVDVDDVVVIGGSEDRDGVGNNIDDVEELFSLLLDDQGEDEGNGEDDINLYGDEDDQDNDDDDVFLISSELEKALLQGVVPVSADVGSEALAGDWGFDPFNFSTKDYIYQAQYAFLQALPGAKREPRPAARPPALILRDYREAEIRHGRLAMLAAVIWPLQEMLDRLILDDDQFGPLIYGPVTLPYLPLLMTLIMMLLGYLDIYANAIRERDETGDAYLPGDCFWDPLQMLEGAPPRMKRNMQERELFNGRVAMLAFAAFVFEEATTHLPVIEIEGNELLFMPAYQIPYIQEWLDGQFLDSYR